MRLKEKERLFIKQIATRYFGNDAKIYLFGSKLDDDKKGRDIDLYLETNSKDRVFDKKLKMLQVLSEQLGEQKIDIAINNFIGSLLYS